MVRKLGYLPETPSQTAGPYLHIGLAPRAAGLETSAPDLGAAIAGPQTRGERVRVEGRVLDGTGTPVRGTEASTAGPIELQVTRITSAPASSAQAM